MAKELYFGRHCEAAPDVNDKSRPLTNFGKLQASALRERLVSVGADSFDIVLCSDATRTVETAREASGGKEPEQIPLLYSPGTDILTPILTIFKDVGKQATVTDYLNHPLNRGMVVQRWGKVCAIKLLLRLKGSAPWQRALVIMHMPNVLLTALALCNWRVSPDNFLCGIIHEGQAFKLTMNDTAHYVMSVGQI